MLQTAKYQPPNTQQDLVLAWLRRARESQLAHYEMANVLAGRGLWLGMPVIILSGLIGTSVLASVLSDAIPVWSKLIIGLLSLSAAVLSSLQTFFNFSDRAEKHRTFGARFGSIRRKLEALYAKREDGLDQQLVDNYRQELDELAEEALHVPVKIFQKIQNGPLFVDEQKIRG